MNQRDVFDVVAIGSITWDRFLTVPRMPQPHDRVRAISVSELSGGSSVATLFPLAKWTLRTIPIGWIGNDDVGRRILEDLDACGIDISLINRCDRRSTRQVMIMVDNGTGQHAVVSDPVESISNPIDDSMVNVINRARCVQIDASDEEVLHQLLRRSRPPGTIVLNIDRPIPDRTLSPLLAWADHILMQANVAQQITRETRPDLCAYAMSLRAGCPVVVIDGGTRVEYADRQECFGVPTCPTNVVDSTGAMAVFRAGYIYGLLAAMFAKERIKFAAWAAAQVCSEVGSRKGIPSSHDVNCFCFQHRAG